MSVILDLRGRVCLVTGGSRGIGRAIVLALAEAGGDVAINYRERVDDALAVAAKIRAMGRRATVVQADVSQRCVVAAMVAATREALGPIDVLDNNAGMAVRRGIAGSLRGRFRAHVACRGKMAGGHHHTRWFCRSRNNRCGGFDQYGIELNAPAG